MTTTGRMVAFEVTVPETDGSGGSAIQMVIHAEHWMEAWKQALSELGEGTTDAAQVTCKIGSDGSVEVVALGSGRRVLVRSLDDAEEAAATDPRVVSGPMPWEEPSIQVEAPAAPVTRERAANGPGAPQDPQAMRTLFNPIVKLERKAPASRPTEARRPQIRRPARRQRAAIDDPVGVVPYVRPVQGGPETSTEEALDMLRRHVICDAAQFLVPAPEGKGWRVEVARGVQEEQLLGELLRTKEAVPGPVDGGPGRRTFAGQGVPVRYSRGFGRSTRVRVKSALWAPVRDDLRVLGLLLLLNARRSQGFTDGELSAVSELAELLAARFTHAGM